MRKNKLAAALTLCMLLMAIAGAAILSSKVAILIVACIALVHAIIGVFIIFKSNL